MRVGDWGGCRGGGKRSLGVAHVNQMQLVLLVSFISHHAEEGFVNRHEEKDETQTHHWRSDFELDVWIHFLEFQNLCEKFVITWSVISWYQIEFCKCTSCNKIFSKCIGRQNPMKACLWKAPVSSFNEKHSTYMYLCIYAVHHEIWDNSLSRMQN